MAPRHVLLVALLLAVSTTQIVTGRRLQDGDSSAAAAAAARAAATTLPASALQDDGPSYLDSAAAAAAAANGSSGSSGSSEVETAVVELRIVNGSNVTTSDFDFMVALFQLAPGSQKSRFFCGGVLLDKTTVLTAAHCMVDTQLSSNPSQLLVWHAGIEYPVEQIFAHPGYSASKIPEDNVDLSFDGSLHDLAIVKLAGGGIPGAPATVGVAGASAPLSPGQPLQVAGWGTTETGSTSSVLKYADVKYLPASYCPPDYDDMVCGGGTGENTCNGDSGGPLLVRDTITGVATVTGVTSHGPDCLSGPNYAYGYYTDVRLYADAIASWTAGEQIVWPAPKAIIPATPTATGAANITTGSNTTGAANTTTGSGSSSSDAGSAAGSPSSSMSEANAADAPSGSDDSWQSGEDDSWQSGEDDSWQSGSMWKPVPGSTGWVTDPSGGSSSSGSSGSSGSGSSGSTFDWVSWDDLYCRFFQC